MITPTKFTKPIAIKYMNISAKAKCEISSSVNTPVYLAKKIMLHVMQFRRMVGAKKSCATSNCEACLKPHLRQVVAAIKAAQPITLVLPAFPAKSPNPAKVLGTLPDMAEQLSLAFLNSLCEQIQTIYSPGARVILCSDGRVFNDVIGIDDKDVTDYQQALTQLIEQAALTHIATYNLDDLYVNLTFQQMREQLMLQHGEELDVLKMAVHNGKQVPCSLEDEEAHRQYCGMTRFLVEDAFRSGQTLSRTQVQKACRQRAYLLIQRSRAWSEFIAERFPDAVRLSIHPQTCGTPKLGIRLLDGENWMTPWHGVAVNIAGNFVLLKRSQAEQLGARLVYQDNRPSHYELAEKE